MTREIPQHIIIESYLYTGTAYDIAAGLNRHYVPLGCRRITARELQFHWEAEIKVNTPMRLLGERPVNGFEQSDEIKLVAQLLGSHPSANFAHGKTRSEHAGSSS